MRVMDTPTGPEIHTFPSDDGNFSAFVTSTWQLHSPADPQALAALLRPSYPKVKITEREPNDGHAVWHVHCYGECVPTGDCD